MSRVTTDEKEPKWLREQDSNLHRIPEVLGNTRIETLSFGGAAPLESSGSEGDGASAARGCASSGLPEGLRAHPGLAAAYRGRQAVLAQRREDSEREWAVLDASRDEHGEPQLGERVVPDVEHDSRPLLVHAAALEARADHLRRAWQTIRGIEPVSVDRSLFLVELEEYGWKFPPYGVLDGSFALYEPPPDQTRFGRAEAAGYLGVDPSSLGRLESSGLVRSRRLRGGGCEYMREELDAVIGRLVAHRVYRFPLLEQEHLALASVPAGLFQETQRTHLYAVEILGVGTKVGISTKPTMRLASHRAAADAFGRSLGREWVSIAHAEARDNERVLVGDSPTEYLRKPFDKVMRAIARLPMTALLALLAFLLSACGQYERPSLPMPVHFADDVDQVEVDAYRDGALAWNKKLGANVLRETADRGGCGLYVIRGDALIGDPLGGKTRAFDDCKVRTYLRPGIAPEARRLMVLHEIGHALLDAREDDHVEDASSILFWDVRAGQAITEANLAAVRARMPAYMLSGAKAGGQS